MTSCPRCGGAQQERLVRVHGRIVLGLYIAGFALAWLWGGAVLHDLAEGVQRSLLPVWKAIVPAVVLITATVALFGRFRQRVCVKCEEAVPAWLLTPLTADRSVAALAGPTRRKVLRVIGGVGTGVAATAGGVAVAVGRNRGWLPVAHDFFMTQVENIAPQARPEWKEASIRSYRRLGRTNAMVSDISLGSGRINDAQVARYAIERGITYFDTAPDYSDNLSERVLGEAMKGHRDKLFLATKFCVRDGHLPNDTSVPKIIEAVEGSLQRLQTDHVDLIH
ncbi:MAG: aldo/keto reductase, partial [Candidatus Binatia bacterium]